MKVLHALSSVAHAAGAHLLDLFLPKVTADARCPEAGTRCNCINGVKFVWDINCHQCLPVLVRC